MPVPIFYAEETEELRDLLENLDKGASAGDKKVSGAKGMRLNFKVAECSSLMCINQLLNMLKRK